MDFGSDKITGRSIKPIDPGPFYTLYLHYTCTILALDHITHELMTMLKRKMIMRMYFGDILPHRSVRKS